MVAKISQQFRNPGPPPFRNNSLKKTRTLPSLVLTSFMVVSIFNEDNHTDTNVAAVLLCLEMCALGGGNSLAHPLLWGQVWAGIILTAR